MMILDRARLGRRLFLDFSGALNLPKRCIPTLLTVTLHPNPNPNSNSDDGDGDGYGNR